MRRRRPRKQPTLTPEERHRRFAQAGHAAIRQGKINRFSAAAAEAGLTIDAYLERQVAEAAARKAAAAARRRERKERIARDQAIADMLGIDRSWYTGAAFKKTRLGQIEAEEGIEGLRREAERRRNAKAREAAAAALKAEAALVGLSYQSWRRLKPEERRRRLEAADKGVPLPSAPDHKSH